MKLFDARLRRIQTGDPRRLLFEVPDKLKQSYLELIKKNPEWIRVRLGPPQRMRTTGDLSQNHKIAALINLIGEETGESYTSVKTKAKFDSLTRGYPYRMIKFQHPATGVETEQVEPYHENEIDTVQASILIQTLEGMCIDLDIRFE